MTNKRPSRSRDSNRPSLHEIQGDSPSGSVPLHIPFQIAFVSGLELVQNSKNSANQLIQ